MNSRRFNSFSIPPARVGLQDIELARTSQEVTEPFFNLLAIGESVRGHPRPFLAANLTLVVPVGVPYPPRSARGPEARWRVGLRRMRTLQESAFTDISPLCRSALLVHRNPARFDWHSPFIDLARDKFAQVFRGPALGGNYGAAHLLYFFLNHR